MTVKGHPDMLGEGIWSGNNCSTWKDKVELVVGLKFREPCQFKETLKLYAIQNSFDSITSTTRRSRYLYCVRKIVVREYMHRGLLIGSISISRL
jgi:hypothetical protein